VVRGAKRPPSHEAESGRPQPRGGVEPRERQRLGGLERRQQPGQPPREHRLARAGRTDEQQVMAAGRGDLQRTPCDRLPAHIREVLALARGGLGRRGRRTIERELAAQPRARLEQRRRRQHAQLLDQRRLGRCVRGADQRARPGAPRRLGERERAARAAHAAIERDLADRGDLRERLAGRLLGRDEQAEREREVGCRAFLAAVGGREVHGHAPVRSVEPRVPQRGPDTIARLARRRIRQANHGEPGQAGAHVDLAVDRECLETPERSGANAREHGSPWRGRPPRLMQGPCSLRFPHAAPPVAPMRHVPRRRAAHAHDVPATPCTPRDGRERDTDARLRAGRVRSSHALSRSPACMRVPFASPALLAGVAVLVGATAAAPAAGMAPPGPPPRGLERMKHLVVLYLENHSFDNLYGQFPGADGFAFAHDYPPQVDSADRPYRTLPVTKDSRLPDTLGNHPFDLSAYVPEDEDPEDLSHGVDDERFQIDGGRMDRFVLGNESKGEAMGYYPTEGLPLAALAHEYTLCDHFFHGVIGGSQPNHIWMIAARLARWPDPPPSVRERHDASGKLVHGGFVDERGNVIGTCQSRLGPHEKSRADSVLVPPQEFPTIGDRLSAKRVSWAWYAGGWNDAVAGREGETFQYHHQPFIFFRRYGPHTAARRRHLLDETDFVAAAKAGTLPAVAFVKPIGRDNEHPGYADVTSGERHALELVHAVMNGPQWSSTAIVITYDEHGGFWDHVAPPVADEWGPGSRVPTLVIAPFAKRHFVDHASYDTTSLLALIEKRWGLAPLAERDAKASPLLGAFDFDQR